MHPRRTATPRTDPPRAATAAPARDAEREADAGRGGVVGEIGDADDGSQRALVARLRRAGPRGERAPASLRARVTAILAGRRGES